METENIILILICVALVIAGAIWARKAASAAARSGKPAGRKIFLILLAAFLPLPILLVGYPWVKDMIYLVRVPAQITSIEALCQIGVAKHRRKRLNSRTDTMTCDEAQDQEHKFGNRAGLIDIARINYRYTSPATGLAMTGFVDIQPRNYSAFSAGQPISVLAPRDGSPEGKFPRAQE